MPTWRSQRKRDVPDPPNCARSRDGQPAALAAAARSVQLVAELCGVDPDPPQRTSSNQARTRRYVFLRASTWLEGRFGINFRAVHDSLHTCGTSLNPDGSNDISSASAALTGNRCPADPHPLTRNPAGGRHFVRAEAVIDTGALFLVCRTCSAATSGRDNGPATINPATGQPSALVSPVITIRDMVRGRKLLLDHLGIGSLFSVIGG